MSGEYWRQALACSRPETGLGVDTTCLSSTVYTEDEHLAYSRLDMTDTVTSSNFEVAQSHKGVGGQKFLNICVHNALNCEFECICLFVSWYEWFRGEFLIYFVRAGVYFDFVLCVFWFVWRRDFQFVGNAPLDCAWQLCEKWPSVRHHVRM